MEASAAPSLSSVAKGRTAYRKLPRPLLLSADPPHLAIPTLTTAARPWPSTGMRQPPIHGTCI
jgi:hypothetical protein